MKRLLVLVLIALFINGCLSFYYNADSEYLFHLPLLEGDCVDKATLTKASLIKQGYEAKIILGFLVNSETKGGYAQAWIKYRKPGEEWLKFDELFYDQRGDF